jgi:hypothetical protein
MSSDGNSETPISRAIKRRKELQDAVKAEMKELEKIEEFLRMYRVLSDPEEGSVRGAETSGQYIFGGAGFGQTQAMFEQLLRATLHDARKPMRSPEIIEAFRERGHPIGGNETRTAWNRLWRAKAKGMLITVPRYGYWLADERLPEGALSAPPPKRKIDPERNRFVRGVGRPVGRRRLLTDSQVSMLEKWLAEGKKTRAEMARDLGGVSAATINNYRVALLRKRKGQTLDEALKELHTESKKRRNETQGPANGSSKRSKK